MKNILISILFASTIFSITVDEATGWEYDQSTLQAFYMLEILTVDGEIAESEDVVGAFFDGVCVGFINAAPEGYTTVPLMGNDGGDYDYLNIGEVPDLFIYDATNGSILPIAPASELPGWAINEIFTIEGTSTASNSFGCTDASACNYDAAATADDGGCLYDDCFGECGGAAVVDDCGVCDGGDEDQDCAGECFGSAIEDCAGVCNGSSSVDNCGDCDDDASNDHLSCSGCTDSCGDNFDDSATIEDGSCEYFIDAIDDLAAASGPSRVILSWTAPSSVCAVTSYNVYDSDGNWVKETSSTSTQIVGLDAGVEYCFTVKASNDNAESESSNEACATSETSEGLSWGLQLTAEINGWGTFIETDDANKLGVSPAASYGYDGAFDAPEPPAGGAGNWVSLYFPHTEWDNQWGDNFTQDIVLENDEFFEHNLTIWTVEVLSNMSGQSSVTFDFIETPLDVPMYVEVVQGDGDTESEYYPITNGSSVDFFLSQGTPQALNVIIGNIVPEVDGAVLNASGGDRSISLDWDGISEYPSHNWAFPATSYSVYREGADDVHNLTDTGYLDNEDREDNNGQGLLYESTWSYTLTASNAAGESTDGYSVRTSGGAQEDIDGTSSSASATTNDNLDPVASVAHVASDDGTNLGDGEYEIPHDGSPEANEITIHVDGSASDDDDEFDGITTYAWTQTDNSGEALTLNGSDTDDVSFSVGNAHDGDTKNFSFNLHVTSDYPVRGGTSTRTSDAQISVSIDDEPNEDPVASDALSLIVGDDGLSVTTMTDADDGNDYDSADQLWYVPHDGDLATTTAALSFDASASSDDDGDDLSYSYLLTAGEDLEWSYGDLNQNGSYDIGEPVYDYGGGEVYINPIEVSDIITYSDNLPADVYVLELTVTDTYGDSDKSALVVGIGEERNEGPTVDAGSDQTWYMPTDQDEFDISMSSHSVGDSDSDYLTYGWDLDGTAQNSVGNQIPEYSEVENDQALAEGDHVFTLTVSDSYGETASDSFTITVLDEPAPVAVNNLSVDDAYNAFKQVQISWEEGVLETDFDGAYTGDLHNTLYFVVSMNGEERATYQNDDGDGVAYAHHEPSLDADSDYEFSVEAFNSDDEGDAISTTSQHTHARPEVTVNNPSGGEIYSVGDDYTVDFSTTNDRFISAIDIQFLGQSGWVDEDENANLFSYSASGDDRIYTGSVASDGTEIHEGAAIKVIVTDIGDASGDNQESNEDSSSGDFTLAAHTISKSLNDGWNLFGSILDVSDGPNGELMVDNLSASFGNWGENWVAYDADGQYENLSLNHGEGFYLALASDDVLVLEGDPVIGDPEDGSLASIALSEGWNLIANPLVVLTDKSEIGVEYNEVTLSFDDAVNAGWIAPSINGWFGDSHFPYDVLQPSGGYWVNTSRNLSLHFTTDGGSSDDDLAKNDTGQNLWVLKLDASSLNSESFGDYLVIGLSDNADSNFKYGEDEYDLPTPMFGGKSAIDIHIDDNNVYLYRDIKSNNFNDYQVWNISGELYGLNRFKLDWIMDDIDNDIHLIVNGDIIDMKDQNSLELDSFNDASIVVGNIGSFLNPIPDKFSLSNAYPNPFNPTTNLHLDLNEDIFVSVKVYSVTGQLVDNLISSKMNAGYHTINWNAQNIASGVYIVKVVAGSNIASQKVMLLK